MLRQGGHRQTNQVQVTGSKQKLNSIDISEKCLNLEARGHNNRTGNQPETISGIRTDKPLTWNEQVTLKITKIVLSKFSLLRNISKYLPQSTRKTFITYWIKPHLNYCSSIWGQTSRDDLITQPGWSLVKTITCAPPAAETFPRICPLPSSVASYKSV